MKIAVSSLNGQTVTAHPGKTNRFLMFEVTDKSPPRQMAALTLPREMILNCAYPDADHPLYSVDVVIAASAKGGLAQRLSQHGVRLVTTCERSPERAVEAFLSRS
ncbi:NifB/NifX family molybdenum-iron cluster-binding protein [Magnetospirillum aberrantis]|uniref:Nitrogen fixation protein n=1 Tax=Magnetospirillum aberrantis SpK TaxID=908842 RepID=A0A7C9QU69_9PROT|nr:nitrogen fixation protein [Magnetospirillum aberrantis]NFV79416.1 nitrogen fixation protein [Magnetospirillum aberrantis SpK]